MVIEATASTMSPSVALFPSIHPWRCIRSRCTLRNTAEPFGQPAVHRKRHRAHTRHAAQQEAVVYLMVSWQVFQILAGNGRVDDERVHADKAFDDGGRARRRLHLPHRRERTHPPSRCSFNGDHTRGFVGGAVFRALRVLLNGMAPAFPFGADALPPQPLRVNPFLQPPSRPPPSVERTSAKPGERNLQSPFHSLSALPRLQKIEVFVPTCDASGAIENGVASPCTAALPSGSSCQPKCANGFVLSGLRRCGDGPVSSHP